MSNTTVAHTAACEAVLRAEIAYNTANKILPSVNRVAERLLSRTVELHDAYLEVHAKLEATEVGIGVFFDGLLNTTAFWNPKKLATARDMRARLDDLNDEIAKKASELAVLLEKRSTINGQDGFYSDTHCDVLEVMEVAARDNPLYEMHVGEKVRALRGRYDLKYWPSLGEFVATVAQDAREAVVEASNPLTAAGTASKRASQADFFRTWFKRIDHDRRQNLLPPNFELSDSAYASFGNCVLNLGASEVVDSVYVKRLRQRDREADRSKKAQSEIA